MSTPLCVYVRTLVSCFCLWLRLNVFVRVCLSVCVCVCVWAFLCVSAFMCPCGCVCDSMSVCLCTCVCVCLCVAVILGLCALHFPCLGASGLARSTCGQTLSFRARRSRAVCFNVERFAATPHVEKPIRKTAANSPPCFCKAQQSASTGARFTGASALPNTSGGDGPLRRRSRLSGRRENWRNVVVLVRVSLKGLSVVEICLHRRSFYGSERVAEHKRRR